MSKIDNNIIGRWCRLSFSPDFMLRFPEYVEVILQSMAIESLILEAERFNLIVEHDAFPNTFIGDMPPECMIEIKDHPIVPGRVVFGLRLLG